MKTKYSYKQIWTITFPILISLIMEQMIGMTDTASWDVWEKSSWVLLLSQGYIISPSL